MGPGSQKTSPIAVRAPPHFEVGLAPDLADLDVKDLALKSEVWEGWKTGRVGFTPGI